MRRLLALHGVGSSSDILRIQLAAVIRNLGSEYEISFFDGPFVRERGPGMAVHYSGPFYSYTEGYSPAEIRDALDDLEEFVQDNGPFDGVIGFSQGASMAASYILDQQERFPDGVAPFGFAVLLSSVAAFSPDANYCRSTVESLVQDNYSTVCNFPDSVSVRLPRIEKLFVDYLASTFTIARKIGATTNDYDIRFFKDRNTATVPRILHSELTPVRIRIPTVHFTGQKDHLGMIEQSFAVMGLCDPNMTRIYQHSGGHAVPSKRQEIESLVRAIEWAAMESSSQFALNKIRSVQTRSIL